MSPERAASYIGIPFEVKGRDRTGIDCWGLLRLFYREQMGIELPSYDGAYETHLDIQGLSDLIRTGKGMEWRPVAPGTERAGDGILFRIEGEPAHVAVVMRKGEMLHIREGIDSCIERYRSGKWLKRIEGFYRYDRRA